MSIKRPLTAKIDPFTLIENKMLLTKIKYLT